MAQYSDLDVLLTDIDAVTNTIAANEAEDHALILQLRDQIANGTPVSQEQLDTLAANMAARRDRLQALAADHSNPIP